MTGRIETHKPPGAGKSSFDLLDPGALWSELDLAKGITFLDLGSGRGNYALAVAKIIGPGGVVYAVDLWEEGIAALKRRASREGRGNLKALLAEAGKIPLADVSVDMGFMATVLHDLVEAGTHSGALKELARVVKPGGRIGIVEFEKIDGPPGPPRHIRLDAEQVEKLVAPYGFSRQKNRENGAVPLFDYLYKKIAGRGTTAHHHH